MSRESDDNVVLAGNYFGGNGDGDGDNDDDNKSSIGINDKFAEESEELGERLPVLLELQELKDPEDDIYQDLDDCWWMSERGMAELSSTSNVPGVEKWSEPSVEKAPFVVTIDHAKQLMWQQGQREVQWIQNSATLMLAKSSQFSTALEAVLQNLLGHNSRIGNLVQEHCSLSENQYYLFMATVFASAETGMTVRSMHSSRRIVSDDLMSVNEFNQTLQKLDDGNVDAANEHILWKQCEEACNKDLIEVFMPSDNRRRAQYILALDDDKVCFEHSSASNCLGLAKHRHIRDNRKGFTIHSVASCILAAPLQLTWNRERETSSMCFQRLMRLMFGAESGDGLPNLTNVTVCSDRGYWTGDLLYKFMIPAGANIHGTVRRLGWFPFTFI